MRIIGQWQPGVELAGTKVRLGSSELTECADQQERSGVCGGSIDCCRYVGDLDIMRRTRVDINCAHAVSETGFGDVVQGS